MAGAAAVALLLVCCGGEEESTGNYPPPIDLPPGYGGMDDETPTDGESPTDQESASDDSDGGTEREFTEWELERHAMPPPERPAGITDPSDDGAIATAIYFVEAISYGLETGVTDPLESVSSTDCVYCTNLLELLAAEDGGRTYLDENEVDVLQTYVDPPDDSGLTVVAVDAVEPDSWLLDRHGDRLEQAPGQAFTQWVVLRWESQSWTVAGSEVDIVEAGTG